MLVSSTGNNEIYMRILTPEKYKSTTSHLTVEHHDGNVAGCFDVGAAFLPVY